MRKFLIQNYFLVELNDIYKKIKNMSGNPPFPTIDRNSAFYLGCKAKRDRNEPLCAICPFREELENQDKKFQENSKTE
jgi:hypothetical protein